MLVREIVEGKTLLGSEPRRNPKYLSPTQKLKKIHVLNAPYGTARQPELEKKFFGAG